LIITKPESKFEKWQQPEFRELEEGIVFSFLEGGPFFSSLSLR
jgi:hypothetical protein